MEICRNYRTDNMTSFFDIIDKSFDHVPKSYTHRTIIYDQIKLKFLHKTKTWLSNWETLYCLLPSLYFVRKKEDLNK